MSVSGMNLEKNEDHCGFDSEPVLYLKGLEPRTILFQNYSIFYRQRDVLVAHDDSARREFRRPGEVLGGSEATSRRLGKETVDGVVSASVLGERRRRSSRVIYRGRRGNFHPARVSNDDDQLLL